MKSSDLAGGAKGEEYDRTENEQDRGTAGAGAAQEQRRQTEWKNSLDAGSGDCCGRHHPGWQPCTGCHRRRDPRPWADGTGQVQGAERPAGLRCHCSGHRGNRL